MDDNTLCLLAELEHLSGKDDPAIAACILALKRKRKAPARELPDGNPPQKGIKEALDHLGGPPRQFFAQPHAGLPGTDPRDPGRDRARSENRPFRLRLRQSERSSVHCACHPAPRRQPPFESFLTLAFAKNGLEVKGFGHVRLAIRLASATPVATLSATSCLRFAPGLSFDPAPSRSLCSLERGSGWLLGYTRFPSAPLKPLDTSPV